MKFKIMLKWLARFYGSVEEFIQLKIKLFGNRYL